MCAQTVGLGSDSLKSNELQINFFFVCSQFLFGTELTGEAIPMVMKINTGLGNPCPFQEPFIYEATSFLYKSPFLDLVHITVYLTWFL